MPTLTLDQQNYYYLQEAERVRIYNSILAALYQAQSSPLLAGGETALDISPATPIPLEAVNTFPTQVHYAANTIRIFAGYLAAKDWKAEDLWVVQKGCYADRFIQNVVGGYAAPATKAVVALEACKTEARRLPQRLGKRLCKTATAKSSLSRAIAAGIVAYYGGLPHQRDALLKALQSWRFLDKICHIDARSYRARWRH